jgi:hypothetical protein
MWPHDAPNIFFVVRNDNIVKTIISAMYILADYKYILTVLPVTGMFRFLKYVLATV